MLVVTSSGATIEGQRHVSANRDIRALLRVGDTLWVATSGGLTLYDLAADRVGRRIVAGPTLPSNSVRTLELRSDSIFVGTDGGLAIFHGDATTVLTPSSPGKYRPIRFANIRSIDFGRDGSWYLGTYGAGLGVSCPDSNFTLTRKDSLLDDKVFGVCEMDDSTFYFATAMGMCAHRDGAWVGFQAGAGIPRGEVRQLQVGPEDRLYLRVGDTGIYRFNGNSATRLSQPGIFPEDGIAAFTIDARDNLWACGRYGGIAVYGGGRWKPATSDPEVDGEKWRCAYADDHGGVFFGSADGLIVAVEDNVLHKIRLPGELWSGNVHSIVSDGSGGLFMVNGGYVVRVNSSGAIEREPAPSPVADLAIAPDGALWAATRWGVVRRDEKGYSELPVDIIVADPAFTVIAFDGRGRLWLGNQDGSLYRYDGTMWMRMADRHEVFDSPLTALTGTSGAGVWAFGERQSARYTGERWVTYGDTLFGGRAVVDVVRRPGGLVAATASDLWVLEDSRGMWEALRREDGSPLGIGSRRLSSLATDESAFIYVGASNGIGILGRSEIRWIGQDAGIGGRGVADLFIEPGRYLWVGFASDGLTGIPLSELE